MLSLHRAGESLVYESTKAMYWLLPEASFSYGSSGSKSARVRLHMQPIQFEIEVHDCSDNTLSILHVRKRHCCASPPRAFLCSV